MSTENLVEALESTIDAAIEERMDQFTEGREFSKAVEEIIEQTIDTDDFAESSALSNLETQVEKGIDEVRGQIDTVDGRVDDLAQQIGAVQQTANDQRAITTALLAKVEHLEMALKETADQRDALRKALVALFDAVRTMTA
jgi:prophage DNA circulation protein